MGILRTSNSNAGIALPKTAEIGQENRQASWNDVNYIKNAVTKCLEFSWQMNTCHEPWVSTWGWHLVFVWVHCKWFSTRPMLLSLFSTCCRKIHQNFNSLSRSCWNFQNGFVNIRCTRKQKLSKFCHGNPENMKLECWTLVPKTSEIGQENGQESWNNFTFI